MSRLKWIIELRKGEVKGGHSIFKRKEKDMGNEDLLIEVVEDENGELIIRIYEKEEDK